MKFLLPFALIAAVSFSCKKDKHDPEEQAKLDKQIIEQYISDYNLNATATGSGLYYVITDPGIGDNPTSSSSVEAVYRGYFTDQTVFDESPVTGSTFALPNVIEGWQEGIPLLKEGGEGILLIPSALGYGPDDVGDIPGNSVLIFDVELIQVI